MHCHMNVKIIHTYLAVLLHGNRTHCISFGKTPGLTTRAITKDTIMLHSVKLHNFKYLRNIITNEQNGIKKTLWNCSQEMLISHTDWDTTYTDKTMRFSLILQGKFQNNSSIISQPLFATSFFNSSFSKIEVK